VNTSTETAHWVKVKNPKAPVTREAWGRLGPHRCKSELATLRRSPFNSNTILSAGQPNEWHRRHRNRDCGRAACVAGREQVVTVRRFPPPWSKRFPAQQSNRVDRLVFVKELNMTALQGWIVIGLLVLIMLGIVGIGAEIEYLPYVWRTYSP
jgi:hypothetical protein